MSGCTGEARGMAHNYTKEEIEEIAERIVQAKPKVAYVFTNTNHFMLPAAREMMKQLAKLMKASHSV